MNRLALIAALLLTSSAWAQQSVIQSGNVTPGHVPMWITNGIVGDGGTPAQGNLTGIGVTTSGLGICQNSGPVTGAYNRICFGVTGTSGVIDLSNFGGASGGLSFSINGVPQGIPAVTLPVVANDFACWATTGGQLKDCGSLGNLAVTNHAVAIGTGIAGFNSATAIVGGILQSATASVDPAFTTTPVLGASGTLGTLGFGNATTGTITLQPATGALGSAVLTMPGVTDTLAGKALANGGTNNSLTASNGGVVWSDATKLNILAGTATALQMLQSGASGTPGWSTATWPATVGATGQVLNSTGANAWGATATPVLGASGTLGSLGFGNATSGIVTLAPVAGALGTVILSLPAATDTLVGKATTDILTNKTYDTAGAGNSFKIAGTAITAVGGSGATVLTNPDGLTNKAAPVGGDELVLSDSAAGFALKKCTITNCFAGATAGVGSLGGMTGVIACGQGLACASSSVRKYGEFWLGDYGAVCDNSTDDSTAFTNALTAAAAVGGTVIVPLATCKLGATISVAPASGYVRIAGLNKLQSKLNFTGTGSFTTTLNGTFFELRDLSISCDVAQTCITVGNAANGSFYSTIERVQFSGGGTLLSLINGYQFHVQHNEFLQCTSTCLQITAPANPDAGDSWVESNYFFNQSALDGTGTGVLHQSGGGWKIFGNKIIGFNNGYWFLAGLAGGVASDIQVQHNSIEGCASSCIIFQNTGTTGTLDNIIIESNEMGGGTGSSQIFITADATPKRWINNINISGNIIRGTNAGQGMALDGISTVNVNSNNVTDAGTCTTGIQIVGRVKDGFVTGNTITNCTNKTTGTGTNMVLTQNGP